MSDFPKLGINTRELLAHVEGLIDEARRTPDDFFGAVNWGDLGVADVEYRLSMLDTHAQPTAHVLVEEASPGCMLERWLNERLDHDRFPSVFVACEW